MLSPIGNHSAEKTKIQAPVESAHLKFWINQSAELTIAPNSQSSEAPEVQTRLEERHRDVYKPSLPINGAFRTREIPYIYYRYTFVTSFSGCLIFFLGFTPNLDFHKVTAQMTRLHTTLCLFGVSNLDDCLKFWGHPQKPKGGIENGLGNF